MLLLRPALPLLPPYCCSLPTVVLPTALLPTALFPPYCAVLLPTALLPPYCAVPSLLLLPPYCCSLYCPAPSTALLPPYCTAPSLLLPLHYLWALPTVASVAFSLLVLPPYCWWQCPLPYLESDSYLFGRTSRSSRIALLLPNRAGFPSSGCPSI